MASPAKPAPDPSPKFGRSSAVWVYDDAGEPQKRGELVPEEVLDAASGHTLVQVRDLGILSPPDGGAVRCVRLLSGTAAATLYRQEAQRISAAEVARLQLEVVQLKRLSAQSVLQTDDCTVLLKEGQLMRWRQTMMNRGRWEPRLYELRCRRKPTSGNSECAIIFTCFTGPRQRKVRMEVTLSAECRIAPVTGPEEGSGLYCFELRLPEGMGPASTIRMGTESEKEAENWVSVLEEACGAAPSVESIAEPSGKQAGAKRRAKHGLRAVHKESRDSMLTTGDDGVAFPECSFFGIFNLCVLVLVTMNFRLIIENFMKYGVLLDPVNNIQSHLSIAHLQCLLCLICLPIFAAISLGIEMAASHGYLPEHAAFSLHSFNVTLSLAVPIGVIQQTQASPAVGAALLLLSTTLFLKLWSYAHVNMKLRSLWGEKKTKHAHQDRRADASSASPMDAVVAKSAVSNGSESILASVGPSHVEYPSNLSSTDMLLFMAYPTLVYQTSYPRSSRVRKSWLFKRVIEMALALALMAVIIEQFIAPAVKNAAGPIQQGGVLSVKFMERVLKLAIPSAYAWLCMFYVLFHLWLNILAEITRFGDRLFYKEWWNATKLEDYWRFWNLPVHNWLVNHVFLPCLDAGMGATGSMLVVFFFSAVFHELLVSIPCHTFQLWAFWGMMAQAPLVFLTAFIDRHLQGNRLGNFVFWISFCIVGQPLCVLLYYADFASHINASE